MTFGPRMQISPTFGTFKLLHVGHQVVMREDRAFRHPRRAARVLQERDVIVGQGHIVQHLRSTLPQCGPEADCVRDPPLRHHLLDMFHHEAGKQRPGPRQQVADLRCDDALATGLRQSNVPGPKWSRVDLAPDHLAMAAGRLDSLFGGHDLATPERTGG